MSLEQIKKIREQTGAGMVDVKKALDEANGDDIVAIEILRKKGQAKALKKTDREAKEGTIGIYLHSNGKICAMVKLYCETDFVARNDEFRELAKDIAMHISALNPKFLKIEDVSADIIKKEKNIWKEQLKNEGKPETMIDRIMDGKEKKFREEISLLSQFFVKNPDLTIQELVTEKIGKIGENIQIGEFSRFEL
jgi:elongation factor Ts